jgi:hypothetical protein
MGRSKFVYAVAGFAAFVAYRIWYSKQDNYRRLRLFDAIENHNERKPLGKITAPKS